MLRPLKILLLPLLIFMSNQIMADDFWIDVRTDDEFNSGHINNAAHIPFEEIAQRIGEVTNDKDATIHLYCRTGRRSGIAQETLQQLGFKHAINEGGYDDIVHKQAQ